MNYEIAVDLTKANFDFYAGGGFLKPDKTYDKKDAPDIFPIFEEAGYTVARGYSDYKAKNKGCRQNDPDTGRRQRSFLPALCYRP